MFMQVYAQPTAVSKAWTRNSTQEDVGRLVMILQHGSTYSFCGNFLKLVCKKRSEQTVCQKSRAGPGVPEGRLVLFLKYFG